MASLQQRGHKGEEPPGLMAHPLGHLQLGSGDTGSGSSRDFLHVPLPDPRLIVSLSVQRGRFLRFFYLWGL